MQIERRAVERHLAAGDAGQVEQVVDQPRLQLDVAPDHGQGLGHARAEVAAVLEPVHGGHDGRQRRAKLVGQRREEPVLGRAGLLGPLPRVHDLAALPAPLGDVAHQAAKCRDGAVLVADRRERDDDVEPAPVLRHAPRVELGDAPAGDQLAGQLRRRVGTVGRREARPCGGRSSPRR